MTRILILEGDDPHQLAISARQGQTSNAAYYSLAFQSISPSLTNNSLDLQIDTVQPYHHDFNLDQLDLAPYDGVVFTGSTVNWSVDDPEAKPLRDTMEKVFAQGIPTLGSCNGMQLAAVVLGGQVADSPNGRELGMARNIRLTKEGQQHMLHQGREDGYACCCIHRDEVSQLPTDAILTATNDHSQVQAFVYEQGAIQFWGMQYHPEMKPGQISALIAGDGLFTGEAQLAEDLAAIQQDSNSDAVQRLGIRVSDLAPEMMMRELYNWLRMIRQR